MQSSRKIKLIYELYENEGIHTYDGFEQETKIDSDYDDWKVISTTNEKQPITIWNKKR